MLATPRATSLSRDVGQALHLPVMWSDLHKDPVDPVAAQQMMETGLSPEMLGEELHNEISARSADYEKKGPEAQRKKMDGAARIAKAEACKKEANEHFAAKRWHKALAGYVAGIWYIARGEPECPWVVVHPRSADDDNALHMIPEALGAGAPATLSVEVGDDAMYLLQEDKRDLVRMALHLNVAAAALKISQWPIAIKACEYVIESRGAGAPAKARFRLAKAYEGDGRLDEAKEALDTLLAIEPDHPDGKKFHEKVSKALRSKHEDIGKRLEAMGKVIGVS